ncbi:hypothetical protein [Marmoricola sp. OAE513]|uniref:hypothetical protein n=1 Tax=Marmoricola sp. OAE513 TaxID=2817894 RepID=UPI001AE3F277
MDKPGERTPLIERTVPEDWIQIYLAVLALVALLLVAGGVGAEDRADARAADRASTGTPQRPGDAPDPKPAAPTETVPPPGPSGLPRGARTIFEPNRVLVAYYGTAGTASLGVLGESSPEKVMPRLAKAAKEFAVGGRTVQPVFELIVTVAHAGPTDEGDYSTEIDRDDVRRYIDAAHRHGVLLLLDLQPGKADFLKIAKRWQWALEDPWVGLALDPEWRMSQGGVPGQRVGSVGSDEVNRVSAWLANLTSSKALPEKIFLLHQFRADMVRGIERVQPRAGLAMVQHVDGYGTPREKLATYRALVRPRQFHLGFKLFYDEDVPRMTPARVLQINPKVSFVSFQ